VVSETCVLVVDDEATSRTLMVRWLEREGFRVFAFETAEAGLLALDEAKPDVVCLDLEMPGMGGIEALGEVRKRMPRVPVVILTATREVATVVEAMQAGAYDFVTKSPDRTKLITTIRNAAEKHRLLVKVDALEGRGFQALLGESAVMRNLFKELNRVSASDVTVLIRGESGTGKELVAHAIHTESPRRSAPFISLNCAAVPESLQESEFFGHEKGAFTGALSTRKGHFELAHSGTLFMDEIGELSLALQAKLLRVLQERTFQRVGGSHEIRSNFRLIAATHRDLSADVKAGRFRQDLYFRIAVFEVDVPPLRSRVGDVALLARHFLKAHDAELELSPEAESVLKAHDWPGNVRELQNAIQRAAVITEGKLVNAKDLPARLVHFSEAPCADTGRGVSSRELPRTSARPARLSEMEKHALMDTLKATEGNVTEAVRRLGIGRTTMYRMMKRYGIR
jgi:two-component system, NtrC family, response regulator AtoC